MWRRSAIISDSVHQGCILLESSVSKRATHLTSTLGYRGKYCQQVYSTASPISGSFWGPFEHARLCDGNCHSLVAGSSARSRPSHALDLLMRSRAEGGVRVCSRSPYQEDRRCQLRDKQKYFMQTHICLNMNSNRPMLDLGMANRIWFSITHQSICYYRLFKKTSCFSPWL